MKYFCEAKIFWLGLGLSFQATKRSSGGAGACPRQGQRTEFGQIRSGCKVNMKSELYIQALGPGCFTRFENSENWSSPGCFTSTINDEIRAFMNKKYFILLTLIRLQEVEHILFLGKSHIDYSLQFPSRLLSPFEFINFSTNTHSFNFKFFYNLPATRLFQPTRLFVTLEYVLIYL